MRRAILYFVAVVHLVIADAVSKELAAGFLRDSAPLSVIPGFFDLAYVENRGCAWGMFQGQVWPLAAFAVLALALLVWKRESVFGRGRCAAVSEALLYAGIVGNLLALLPWPLNQLDHGTESFGHALVLVLGLILLKEMKRSDELKQTEGLA